MKQIFIIFFLLVLSAVVYNCTVNKIYRTYNITITESSHISLNPEITADIKKEKEVESTNEFEGSAEVPLKVIP